MAWKPPESRHFHIFSKRCANTPLFHCIDAAGSTLTLCVLVGTCHGMSADISAIQNAFVQHFLICHGMSLYCLHNARGVSRAFTGEIILSKQQQWKAALSALVSISFVIIDECTVDEACTSRGWIVTAEIPVSGASGDGFMKTFECLVDEA